MNEELLGPEDRYSVEIEVLASSGGRSFTRYRAEGGIRLDDGGIRRYRVVVPDICTMILQPGENGFTVRSLQPLRGGQILVKAHVAAGPGAPDWLPPESTYLVFEGSRERGGLRERFFPLEGFTEEGSVAGEEITSLDRLAVAVGRSVARANAALARTRQVAGVALVSSVTIRVAVEQAEVCQGRVLVTLARPGDGQTGQFVEFAMTTVPGAEDDGAAAGSPDGEVPAASAPAGGTSRPP